MNNFCAYTTATNDQYLKYAITSLLSVRANNQNIPLFIIGKKFSRKNRKLIKSHDISIIEIDLSRIFFKAWEYPIECYYIFSGPQIFYKLGFQKSLYIDGDVYCNNQIDTNLPLKAIAAGVENGTCEDILKTDLSTIKLLWGAATNKDRIQTGVVYFNNQKASEINMLSSLSKLFEISIQNNIPRKGDDSLMALFMYINNGLKFEYLDKKNNFIEKPNSDISYNDVIFYHFTSGVPKPWEKRNDSAYSNLNKHFSDLWCEVARQYGLTNN